MKLILLPVVVCALLAVFGDGHKRHKHKSSSSESTSKEKSSSKHNCKAPKCPRLKYPHNGRIVTTATVICDDGYVINGNDQIMCQENGKWSNDLPSCVEDPCLNGPCGDGGSCVANGTDYTCQCFTGYSGRNCEVQSLQKFICEGDNQTLECNDPSVLLITSANFGRTAPYAEVCPSGRMSGDRTDCYSDKYTQLSNQCDGTQMCAILVTLTTMGGDPCKGTYKYLNVTYLCVCLIRW